MKLDGEPIDTTRPPSGLEEETEGARSFALDQMARALASPSFRAELRETLLGLLGDLSTERATG